MLVIPVIDIQGGLAVHAVKGQRTEYRSVVTPFADSADPVALANGYRDQLGTTQLYVADLDAIGGKPIDEVRLQSLGNATGTLWIDVGCRTAREFQALRQVQAKVGQRWRVIVPLENLVDGNELQRIVSLTDTEDDSIVFSLDMREGVAIGSPFWQGFADPVDIAQFVINLGIRNILLLDLGTVGAQNGPAALALIHRIREVGNDVSISLGGGVRNVSDLQLLASAGCDAALVATALHRGDLSTSDLCPYLS